MFKLLLPFKNWKMYIYGCLKNRWFNTEIWFHSASIQYILVLSLSNWFIVLAICSSAPPRPTRPHHWDKSILVFEVGWNLFLVGWLVGALGRGGEGCSSHTPGTQQTPDQHILQNRSGDQTLDLFYLPLYNLSPL